MRIKLVAPPEWNGSFEAWADRIRAGVAAEERKAADRRAVTGEKILGRKAVLAASPHQRPTTKEPRRGLRQCIAAKSPSARPR